MSTTSCNECIFEGLGKDQLPCNKCEGEKSRFVRREKELDPGELISKLRDSRERFIFQGGSEFALGIARLLENKQI